VSSLDRILPFLKPIEDLLLDPAVTEVMVNEGGRRVFVEREGMIEGISGRTLETRNLTVAIKNIARACGDEISDIQPLLDARLEDGSRVAAMFPPCAVGGPVLTIRKFTRRYTLRDLVSIGALCEPTAEQLTAAIRSQHNILISGGTGTGKTTLLNALAAHIPEGDRIVVKVLGAGKRLRLWLQPCGRSRTVVTHSAQNVLDGGSCSRRETPVQ
jgi:Flp pilus assembly CpaF family ATPase